MGEAGNPKQREPLYVQRPLYERTLDFSKSKIYSMLLVHNVLGDFLMPGMQAELEKELILRANRSLLSAFSMEV